MGNMNRKIDVDVTNDDFLEMAVIGSDMDCDGEQRLHGDDQ